MSSITINTIAGDDVLNAIEHGTSLVISGDTSGVADTARVNLTLNGSAYYTYLQPGQSAWSITIYPGDVGALADGSYTVHAQTFEASTYNAVTGDRTLLVATALPSITIGTIAGDDVLNAQEQGGSLAVSGTATGADGQTVTLALNGQSYTATVVSGAWTVTVPQGDVAGMSVGSSYSANASVSDSYGNAATPASHSLLVTAMPTVAISTIAGDDVINATEHAASLVVSGTATHADGQTVTFGLNGQSYAATVVNGAWSVTVPTGDVGALGNGSIVATANVSDGYGDTATPATRSLQVVTTLPTVTIGTIAGDDVLNAQEQGGSLAVSGTATGADGQTVTLALNGQSYTATVVSGAWTVSVPQGDVAGLSVGSSYSASASVSDSYGNAATPASHSLLVAAMPTVAISTIAGDDVINATEHASSLVVSGTATHADGQTVTFGLNGHSYAATVVSGAWSVTVPTGDVGALGNGSIVATASVSDGYGDTATPATRSLQVVTTLPTVTIGTIAGDDVLNAQEQGGSLAVSGTATGADGQTVTLALNGQSYTATVVSGAWTVSVPQGDVAGLSVGSSYSASASVSDSYGNAATPASHSLLVAAMPTVAISTIAGDDVINATEHAAPLVVSGTATHADGQTVTLGLNGHSYAATVSGGTWSATVVQADVAALTDGAYTATASVSDAYGDAATPATRSLQVATSLPIVTIGTIAGDDVLNAQEQGTSLVVSGTATGVDGRTVTVGLNGQSYAATVVSGGWTVTVPQGDVGSLVPGHSYSASAAVSDIYGNAATAASHGLLVAAAPTITLSTIAGDDVVNAVEHGSAVAVGGTATGAEGQSVTFGLNGHSYAATVSGGTWSATVAQADVGALADGSYTATASVSDIYGGAATPATRTLRVATTLPSVTIRTIAGDDAVNAQEHGAALTIGGTATGVDGRTVTIGLHGQSYTAVVTSGHWSTVVAAGDVGALADGTTTVTASVSDSNGNAASPASRALMVATAAPTLTIGVIAGDDRVNAQEHGASLTIGGSAVGAAGQTVTVGLNGHSYTGVVANGAWSVSVAQADVAALVDGSVTATAAVSDAFGNPAAPVSRAVLVDTVAAAPSLGLAAASDSGIAGNRVTDVTTPTIQGSAEAGAQLALSLDGQALGTATADGSGAWSYTVATPLAAGAHHFGATQTDLAGNVSAGSADLAVTVTAARPSSDFPTSDPDFDPEYYLAHNPDVAASGMDPLLHYETFGWHEGRNPNAFFNTDYYLSQNPDVAAAGVDPLLHYETFGWKEGRDPSLSFDTNAYLQANPDVAAAHIDPLTEYIQAGQAQDRMTFLSTPHTTGPQDPLVDAAYYYSHNPDVAAAGMDATAHYEASGWKEGRNPDAYFDTNYYLAHNPDVAAAGVDPLLHYETYGWKEGRDPSAAFSTSGYLAANPDVAASGMDPLLHYVDYGAHEGRIPVHV